MTTPMTTKPGGGDIEIEEEEIIEFKGAKGPYGGDPYFRGPLMTPLPQYNFPNIKPRIYVNNEFPSENSVYTTPPIYTTPIKQQNYIIYLLLAIIISTGILVLLIKK
jgi:hypothetical protein